VATSLEFDLSTCAEGRTLPTIRGFRSGLMDEQLLETRFEQPIGCGMRRCEFDHYPSPRAPRRLVIERCFLHHGQAAFG
jgi:hypothetical protein